MRVWAGLAKLWGLLCAFSLCSFAQQPLAPEPTYECSFRLHTLPPSSPNGLWSEWEIATLSQFANLLANGGIPFSEDQLFRTRDPHKIYSAQWEVRTARHFSKEGERFLGVGDISVGRVLDGQYDRKRKDPRGKISSFPDLLSVSREENITRFRLREVKTGALATKNLKRALKQLESGARYLLRELPDAEIDRLEVVIDPYTYADAVLGQPLGGDRYEVAIRGAAISIPVGRRRIPVTLLRLKADGSTKSGVTPESKYETDSDFRTDTETQTRRVTATR